MAASEWTISTLKEHFEQLLQAQADRCQAADELLGTNAKNAAEALVKQAHEYERRLSDLNHEAARINAANANNVSREVYETDKKSGEDWKRRIETQVAAAVPQSEYRAYKDTTSTALTLQAGKREGVGATGLTIFNVIVGLSALVAIMFGVAALLAVRPSASNLPATVYLQPAPGPVPKSP